MHQKRGTIPMSCLIGMAEPHKAGSPAQHAGCAPNSWARTCLAFHDSDNPQNEPVVFHLPASSGKRRNVDE
jgi:hypothetical protein